MGQHDDRARLHPLRVAFDDAHAVGDHDRGSAIMRETDALIAQMRRRIDIVRDATRLMEAGRRE